MKKKGTPLGCSLQMWAPPLTLSILQSEVDLVSGSHPLPPCLGATISSVTQSCPALCDCSTPGLPAIISSQSPPKLMPIESVMPSNHLILCRPLLLPPSIFPNMCVFSNESALHIRWPKYWSFSFSISPSNEYSGLISFRIDWLDLLVVQGTLKSPKPV